MKKISTAILLLTSLAIASSCKKDETNTPAPPMTISGALSGASVLPAPVTTAGTGTVTGSFDKVTKELTYTVTFSNMSGPLTSGHFHIGVPPSNVGSVHAVSFTTLTSPITGKETLTDAGRDALLAGNMYVNLHTQANSGGEVRANVVVK